MQKRAVTTIKTTCSGKKMDIEKRIEALEARVAELERNRTGKRFVPPTVSEVRAHCWEKGYTFDAESFVAFYESNDWRVGKNKMKSWKSACITWAKREQINGKSTRTSGANSAVGRVNAAIDERARQRSEALQGRREPIHQNGIGLETP